MFVPQLTWPNSIWPGPGFHPWDPSSLGFQETTVAQFPSGLPVKSTQALLLLPPQCPQFLNASGPQGSILDLCSFLPTLIHPSLGCEYHVYADDSQIPLSSCPLTSSQMSGRPQCTRSPTELTACPLLLQPSPTQLMGSHSANSSDHKPPGILGSSLSLSPHCQLLTNPVLSVFKKYRELPTSHCPTACPPRANPRGLQSHPPPSLAAEWIYWDLSQRPLLFSKPSNNSPTPTKKIDKVLSVTSKALTPSPDYLTASPDALALTDFPGPMLASLLFAGCISQLHRAGSGMFFPRYLTAQFLTSLRSSVKFFVLKKAFHGHDILLSPHSMSCPYFIFPFFFCFITIWYSLII